MLINSDRIKKLIRANGRRPSAEALAALNRHLETKVVAACQVHDGGRKTLSLAACQLVGIGRNPRL